MTDSIINNTEVIEFRKERNMTQAQAAKAAKCSLRTWQRWEKIGVDKFKWNFSKFIMTGVRNYEKQ